MCTDCTVLYLRRWIEGDLFLFSFVVGALMQLVAFFSASCLDLVGRKGGEGKASEQEDSLR